MEPVVIPRHEWEATYRKLGFSAPAARSYTRMTAFSVDENYAMPDNPIRGLHKSQFSLRDASSHCSISDACLSQYSYLLGHDFIAITLA